MPARLILIVLPLLFIAAAPPRPVTFTVTKTDGSIIRGQLASSDPRQVTIQPMLKGQADGAAVVLPWSEIKFVSGGLTRQRLIMQWKKDHPTDICTDCRGTTKAACAACKGTGRAASSAKDCTTCGGAQTTACKAPRCEDGKVPCPNPCLKPTDSGWVKRADGKKWKRFARAGGYVEVSDGHLGEVVGPQGPAPCPVCQTSLKVACPKCHGTSLVPCAACTAAARDNPCPDCQRGQITCPTCGGLALKPEITGHTAPALDGTSAPAAAPESP